MATKQAQPECFQQGISCLFDYAAGSERCDWCEHAIDCANGVDPCDYCDWYSQCKKGGEDDFDEYSINGNKETTQSDKP